jgi:predicted RNA-binding protein with PIN domain
VPYEKHLLIDGSNIMHAWPELRTLLKGDRDLARERLSQIVSVIHDAEETRVTLVFDGRGDDLVIQCPGRMKTFAHVYTPAGTTADDFIEQVVGKATDPGLCVVATDDRAERQTVEAAGANTVSAEDLAGWVDRALQRQHSQLDTRRRDNDKSWKQK